LHVFVEGKKFLLLLRWLLQDQSIVKGVVTGRRWLLENSSARDDARPGANRGLFGQGTGRTVVMRVDFAQFLPPRGLADFHQLRATTL